MPEHSPGQMNTGITQDGKDPDTCKQDLVAPEPNDWVSPVGNRLGVGRHTQTSAPPLGQIFPRAVQSCTKNKRCSRVRYFIFCSRFRIDGSCWGESAR